MHDFSDRFLAGDVDGVLTRLAPDAVFHSPMADYEGRDTIAVVYGALAQVLGEPRVTSVLRGDGETAVAFRGKAGERDADGMLRVVEGADGSVVDVTLFLRPLDVLLAGIERMKELLSRPAAGAAPAPVVP